VSSTRWGCDCINCDADQVGGHFELPDILEGYVPEGFCRRHTAMILADLVRVSFEIAAEKLKYHVVNLAPDMLLLVRHRRRDLFQKTYVAGLESSRHSRGERFRWLLNLVSPDDPDEHFLEHYLSDPDRYIFVPQGTHHCVTFIMEVAKTIQWYLSLHGFTIVNFADENLLGVGGFTPSGWRNIPASRLWQLLAAGARALEGTNLFFFGPQAAE